MDEVPVVAIIKAKPGKAKVLAEVLVRTGVRHDSLTIARAPIKLVRLSCLTRFTIERIGAFFIRYPFTAVSLSSSPIRGRSRGSINFPSPRREAENGRGWSGHEVDSGG